jgi:hypothetical protein
VTAGKDIEYETFCEIMSNWHYKLWERPKLVVKDFICIADANLLVYTLDANPTVYIKNMTDSHIVAVLAGHNYSPIISFIEDSYMIITGDLGTIRFWRIYHDLIHKYDQHPPWESKAPITQYSLTAPYKGPTMA